MIKGILRLHAKRCPLMAPTDAVKLIYQNEFGVGHLIQDRNAFTARLIREMAEVTALPMIPLTEPIGNGLIRVMLNSPDSCRIDPVKLAECCLQTAAAHHGTQTRFKRKLAELEALCRGGLFAFSPDELAEYLGRYREAGYPPVSHSPIYRETYHPAYRVISQKFLPEKNFFI